MMTLGLIPSTIHLTAFDYLTLTSYKAREMKLEETTAKPVGKMEAKLLKKRYPKSVVIKWFTVKLGGNSRWSSREIRYGSGKILHF